MGPSIPIFKNKIIIITRLGRCDDNADRSIGLVGTFMLLSRFAHHQEAYDAIEAFLMESLASCGRVFFESQGDKSIRGRNCQRAWKHGGRRNITWVLFSTPSVIAFVRRISNSSADESYRSSLVRLYCRALFSLSHSIIHHSKFFLTTKVSIFILNH